MTTLGRCSRLVFAASLIAFAGCDSAEDDTDRATLRPLTMAEQAVIGADQQFGLELLATLSSDTPNDNVVSSPLSVSMALGMATNGAAGVTGDEMIAVLAKDGLGENEVNATYAHLLDALPAADPNVEINIGNSVWHRDTFPIESEYLDRVAQTFEAEITALDFTSASAVDTINDWVSTKTEGLIPTIVDAIPPNAVAYLINAVYFKGAWQIPFDTDKTVDGDFNNIDGTTSPVKMMSADGLVAQYRGGGSVPYVAVDLPYGDSLFSMTVLLPDPDQSVNDLIAALDTDELSRLTAGLQPDESPLFLPRFTVEHKVKLNDALKAMGMPTAFDESAADFSRISSQGQLYLSSVLHKTFVSVDEEGTEAAAATSVEVGVTSVPIPIRIDRPFLFLIRERTTGTLLFTGKVVKL